MKKLVMILVLGVTMISCDNKPTEVKNPKQETTTELQQLASIDSVTYKVVEKDDTVYILSTKDNTVVKKVNNYSGTLGTMTIAFFAVIVVLWLIVLFKD
jgi:uncharacterized membrane protein YjjP (DUF1212 family)